MLSLHNSCVIMLINLHVIIFIRYKMLHDNFQPALLLLFKIYSLEMYVVCVCTLRILHVRYSSLSFHNDVKLKDVPPAGRRGPNLWFSSVV